MLKDVRTGDGVPASTAFSAAAGSPIVGDRQTGHCYYMKGDGTIVDLKSYIYNVKDYGAVGNGTADDTDAIQDALTAAAAAVQSRSTTGSGSSTSISYGTTSVVHFPTGVYKVTSGITITGYVSVVGEDAIILPLTDNFTVFSGAFYRNLFRGLQFGGGQRAIHISTSNADSSVVTIKDCSFLRQTASSISTDNNSASTLINISGCKFYNALTTAKIGEFLSGDRINFTDNWVEAGCNPVFQVGDATHVAYLHIDGMLGVPLSGVANGQTWVTNYGWVTARRSRFGGENSGAIIVKNYAAPDLTYPYVPKGIAIDDCEVYCASSEYPFYFYDIPNQVRVTNCRGFTDSKGFYFDSTIPAATTDNMSAELMSFEVRGNSVNTWGAYAFGNSVAECKSFSQRYQDEAALLAPNSTPAVADKILQFPVDTASYTPSTSSTGVSTSSLTNQFGQVMQGVTATADGGNYQRTYGSALNGLAAGRYTLCIEVINLSEQVLSCRLAGSLEAWTVPVLKGRHILCRTFYYDGGSEDAVAIQFLKLKDTQAFSFGNIRIFSGVVDISTANNVCTDTAAPGSLYWAAGDVVWDSTPASGAPPGWVCTASGTPGTWKAMANLA